MFYVFLSHRSGRLIKLRVQKNDTIWQQKDTNDLVVLPSTSLHSPPLLTISTAFWVIRFPPLGNGQISLNERKGTVLGRNDY